MEEYNKDFKEKHSTLNDLVGWLMAWDRYNSSTKRSSETSQTKSSKRRINRESDDTNETG